MAASHIIAHTFLSILNVVVKLLSLCDVLLVSFWCFTLVPCTEADSDTSHTLLLIQCKHSFLVLSGIRPFVLTVT